MLAGCSGRNLEIPRTRVARTTGGAVALSADERVAVVTNRSESVITVFRLAPEKGLSTAMITGATSIPISDGSEPWASVVDLDDDTAYVLFRSARSVGKITGLHSGKPKLEDNRVGVGSEPTAITISPSGQKLFVANWGEGTVSLITTSDFLPQAKIDLNEVLVETGALGSVTSRPGLAHPRALAITDNGDDDDLDETLYATEFFSQPIPGVDAAADPDITRLGLVYPMSVKSGQPADAIRIAAVPQTGFADSEGSMTGCFPNQLYAAAADGGRLYVTSMCTSPRGPLGPKAKDGTVTDKNFKTLFHPAVFVVDTTTNQELPEQRALLTQMLDGYYQNGEDATNERMPLIPNDIVFASPSPGGSRAYVSALGADAVFPLDYDQGGSLQQIGAPGARYIDANAERGLPIGVAVSKVSTHPFGLIVSDAKARLSIVDLETQTVTFRDSDADSARATSFRDSDEALGRGFFGTGRDIWSFKGQAWSSCQSCHPDGLSDGVTWSFARGPRRTISTAGTYEKTEDPAQRQRRMLLWGANIDELHDVEAIVRGVSGGVGAVGWGYSADHADNQCRLLYDGSAGTTSTDGPCLASKSTTYLDNGLNGSLAALDTGNACSSETAECDVNAIRDWPKIDSFIRALRAPRAPTDLPPESVAAGLTLFRSGRCAGCHGGPGWTLSKLFYTPSIEQNGSLPYKKPTTDYASVAPRLGALRSEAYTVPEALWPLNPAAASNAGVAPFRNVPPVPDTADAFSAFIDALYAGAGDDQIRCVLRDVGTFPAQAAGRNVAAVTPVGARGVMEVRQDGTTLAQGQMGFNIPTLFGLSLGAPYFHAGNARTLEEAFDSKTFAQHHQALSADFLMPGASPDSIRDLVTFLLSIDESTPLEPLPTVDPAGLPISYDFCAQAP
jgi:DNA-binding beta-propeller fold protein YncE/mono/diheme cytochrome c family protein